MSQSSPLVSAKPLVRLNKIPSRDRIIEEEENTEDSDKNASSSNGQEQCSSQPLNSLMVRVYPLENWVVANSLVIDKCG